MNVSCEEADARRLCESWQHPAEVNRGRLEEEGTGEDSGHRTHWLISGEDFVLLFTLRGH